MSEDNFFSRWSRRKADVRAGVEVPEPVLAVPLAVPVAVTVAEDGKVDSTQPEQPPTLTIEDTHSLTPESDFKPFVQNSVSPDVKNAALKKLFADPHYNVMDGMDTYIDDYSKADPIPEDMLRRMVGSQLLNLFGDQPTDASDATAPSVSADAPANLAVAQSEPQTPLELEASSSSEPLPALSPAHDDPLDLQLQPNNAIGSGGLEQGLAAQRAVVHLD